MIGKPTYSLLLAAMLAAGVWGALPPASLAVLAGPEDSLTDADDDFLPDDVEWAVLTNAANPDTDGDLCPDFVEVVQRGNPRHAGSPLPADHEMRVVVTAPPPGNPTEPTWLHLFLRFAGSAPVLTSFESWMELAQAPGLRVPLSMMSFGPIVFRQRMTATDGLWVQFSVPIVSEQVLRHLLPCSIRAEATVGGRQLSTGVRLFDVQGVTSTLVPFGPVRFAVQSIGGQPMVSGGLSNKICLLELDEVGSGPGGTVYEVTDADCDDCNELECGAGCPETVGWVLSIPGGIGTITGR